MTATRKIVLLGLLSLLVAPAMATDLRAYQATVTYPTAAVTYSTGVDIYPINISYQAVKYVGRPYHVTPLRPVVYRYDDRHNPRHRNRHHHRRPPHQHRHR